MTEFTKREAIIWMIENPGKKATRIMSNAYIHYDIEKNYFAFDNDDQYGALECGLNNEWEKEEAQPEAVDMMTAIRAIANGKKVYKEKINCKWYIKN